MANSLNKVVEQVAYKQVEEMIVLMEMLSEQIIATSKTAKANQIQFATPSTSNGDMNKKLAESQTIIKKLQTEHTKLQNSYDALIKKVDAYTKATERNNTEKKKLSERDRQYVIDAREITKIQDNEARVLSGLTTYMQKLIAVRAQYAQTVETYNAKIAMGVKLSNDEQFELYQSIEAHKKYDTAIKAGNASTGKAYELVGQYERANRGLNNSIAQIARELPSATFGFQTFALGISNNVPIAVDAIKEATDANKELIAQGKPTVSVWKQVVGAIFSFNTIMSVGLLLLALFGKEISKAVSSLFGMKNAVDLNKKSLEEHLKAVENFNEKSAEMAAAEISNAKKLLFTAQNRKATDKERLKAVDDLQRRYPSYLGNLKQEDILTGNIRKTELELINALRMRAIAMASQDLLTENLKKQIKAEMQYSKVLTNTKDTQSLYDLEQKKVTKSKQDYRLITEEEAESLENLKKKQEQSIETVTRYGKAYKVQTLSNDNIRTNSLIPLKEEEKILEQILNKYSQFLGVVSEDTKEKDKNTKSIKLNTKAREDYLANEYELLHLRLTNVANANKDIMNDEASNFDLRLQASEQYYNNLIDLANMEAKEQLRVLEFATNDRLRTIQNEYFNIKEQRQNELKEGKISRADYNKVMKDAEENLQYDRTGIIKDNTNQQNIIYENQAQNLINANKELVGQMRKAWDEINFQKGGIEIGNVELKGIQELGNMLSEIGNDMSIEQIQRKLQEINNISKESSNDINRREAQIQLDRAIRNKQRIELEIRENGVINNLSEEQINEQLFNNKALQDADAEIIASKKRVTEADNAKTQQEIENLLRVKEEERRFNDAVYEGRIELYNSIKDLGSQLFENQISDYDRQIEKSNEYYDSLLSNAEAGSEQEQLLQEEKERKENELQQRKIALQRRQALFNKLLAAADIGIKLQQEIANNNATFPFPANQAINALSIASAGVRLATVLSTPLPQYERGRLDGPEETALINEKRIEPVESKDGKVRVYSGRNRIVNLKAGDIVHKSVEDFQKNKMSLENASIMASFVNQANQLKAFDNYLGKELNGLSGKIEKGIEKGFKKAKINNNNQINFDFGRKPSNFFN